MIKSIGDRSVRMFLRGGLMALGMASLALAQQQQAISDRDTFSMAVGSESRGVTHWKLGQNHPKGLIHYWLVADPVNGGVRISDMAQAAGFKVLGSHRDLGKIVYKVELNSVDGADAAEARLKTFPEFFSLEPVTNHDKIHRDLADDGKVRLNRKWASSATGQKDPLLDTVRVNITHRFANTVDLLIWAKKQGIVNVKVVTESVLEGNVLWGQIDAISGSPQVRSIDPFFKWEPLNDISRSTLQLRSLQFGASASGYLDTVSVFGSTWNSGAAAVGRNIVVGVFDGGVDDNDSDLRVSPTVNRRAPIVGTWNANNGAVEHGSHVAGTILGNGVLSAARGGRPYQWRGIAPWAQIFSFVPDFASHPVDVGNFSVVAMGTTSEYNANAKAYDDLLADHTLNHRLVYAFAEGNNGMGAQYGTQQGYFSALNCLKNGIKVGAVDKMGLQKAPFSSMGPTRDGRLAPDIMAPGAGVVVNGTISVKEISMRRGATLTTNFWDPNASAATYTPMGTGRNLQSAGGIRSFTGGQGIGYTNTLPTASRWTIANGDVFTVTIGGTAYPGGVILFFTDGTYAQIGVGTLGALVQLTGTISATWLGGAIGKTISGVSAASDFVGPAIKSVGVTINPSTGARTYGYAEMSGTSMATPMVSGTIALMHERFTKVTGRTHTDHMWNSTVKAILIHTAKDMVSPNPSPGLYNNPDFLANSADKTLLLSDVYGTGPDWATGYGLIDDSKAVGISGTNKVREDTARQGTPKSYSVTIPAGKTSFRATLAWDDPGSSGNTQVWQKALENDLDLTMTSPTGVVFRPWVLDPGVINDSLASTSHPTGIDPKVTLARVQANPAHPGIDSLNNVEVVDLTNPVAGAWTITVTPRLITVNQNPGLAGMNQDFSLVTDTEAIPKSTGPLFPKDSVGFRFNLPASTTAALLGDGSIWLKDCTGTAPVTGGFGWWSLGVLKASLLPTSGLRSATYAASQAAWLASAANRAGGAIVFNPAGNAMFRVGQDGSIRVAGASNCSATGF